ncbi:23S rRNA (guanosine(2251)-2'-O)-methyltransferase RlmB [Candidatus Walczuchella monophlebidarum]|uniref:TrmH family RNA methyltransferase n=1 Tax=Candidatus Walczuchella monophlebidarum TaxID=1415657 RepID=A0A068DNY4_9FLAO|nr:23S rRNA (guanosine(2251)-2'-O)-methyltransferase RlmB [Candidatus Walczuchella monophlebidarum]AID37460.1 TrmH family RNA methyltransferase [Candidatus Walczuchella monophlebidarum]
MVITPFSNSIYGFHPLIEAIKSGKIISKIFLQKGLLGNNYYTLYELIKKHRIPFQNVSLETLNRLTKKNHQGVFAFISSIDFHCIENLLPKVSELGNIPLFLVLDGITDVRNFGAIIRTSECFGVNAIIIPSKGSAPVNSDTIKTSSGAIFKIPICKENNLLRSLIFLKKSGLHIIAATEKADTIFYEANLSVPLAIILGNEEKGISKSCLSISDERLKLPMLGTISSLNVSVVCGVLLYEILRQRVAKL